MELKYVAEMAKHNLKVSDLPEDAQIGIDSITDALKGVKMQEAKGREISPKAKKKIEAMDKWVLYEIYDMVNDTDKNQDEIPFDENDVLADLKETENKATNEPKKTDSGNVGDKIDADLVIAYQSGQTKIALADLESVSKTAYDVIWKSYDNTGENGITTSNFTLIETEEEVFTLNKK
jgi:hypothetical protein